MELEIYISNSIVGRVEMMQGVDRLLGLMADPVNENNGIESSVRP